MRVRREPCRSCGGPKEPGRARTLCDECREKLPRGKCTRCGAKKTPGRGRRLCDECAKASAWKPVQGVRPCRNCGGTTNKQKSKQLCDDCRELRLWARQTKRRNQKAAERKVCAGCGKPKGAGPRRRYCDACIAARALTRCVVCGKDTIKASTARMCEDCRRTSDYRRRARQLRYRERLMSTPEGQEILRERSRRARAKMTNPRKQRARENQRIYYRLRKEREGVEVEPATVRAIDTDTGGQVPALPLALAIEAIAAEEAQGNPWGYGAGERDSEGALTVVSERAGTSARSVFAWRRGEREVVQLHRAVDVLDRLDLFWWEVWTEDTVRLPALTVIEYAHQTRRGSERKLSVSRRYLYGDLGPDLDGLGRVERLMTKQRLGAAA